MGESSRSFLLVYMVVHTYTMACGFSVEKCPPGYYYDNVVERCDSCYQLCQFADIQGTKEDCQRQCPGYSNRNQLTTVQKVGSAGSDPEAKPCDTVVVIMGLTSVTVLLLVISAVAILMRRTGRTHCKTYARRFAEGGQKHDSPPLSTVDLLKPLQEHQMSDGRE